MSEKWMYQIGEDNFWYSDEYNTKKEAIEACKKAYLSENHEGDTCYVGRVNYYNPFITGYSVIDLFQNDSYCRCGEASDGFLDDVTKEQAEELQDKLNDVLQEWLIKYNLQPTFGDIVDVEEITVLPDCPICGEGFEAEEKESHVYCNQCGHKFI